MKKLTELQVATKPWGSSIRASSTPILFDCEAEAIDKRNGAKERLFSYFAAAELYAKRP
jgi:hypothetical protein